MSFSRLIETIIEEQNRRRIPGATCMQAGDEEAVAKWTDFLNDKGTCVAALFGVVMFFIAHQSAARRGNQS